MKEVAVVLSIILFFLATAFAEVGKKEPAQHTAKDKCPVCGMLVYKYPDWIAQIVFADGATRFFDGSKDMFKYYFNIKKHDPDKNTSQIRYIYVKDYYSLEYIDATKAFYVYDSEVYSPMGRELVPFSTEADAQEFKRDHGGAAILRFQQITKEKVLELE